MATNKDTLTDFWPWVFSPMLGKNANECNRIIILVPFLKKNQEISEMHLEGNGERVKEIKPGEDNIILYKNR